MLPTEPLPLHHSWPIFERGLRLSEGLLDVGYSAGLAGDGLFSCDLTTDRLTWSDSTFALFGLSRGVAPVRALVLSLYRPESRSAVERLRNHAIRHHRGFTIDTAVDAPGQPLRWLRVVAVPDIEKGRAVRLRGMHQDVTHEYR
ncbi:MAG: hypothetical protein PGN21_06260 [Sphingomonas paucimobilis]